MVIRCEQPGNEKEEGREGGRHAETETDSQADRQRTGTDCRAQAALG